MIHVQGRRFHDEHGRTLMLRGVNLGGSSKVPYRPRGSTHIHEGFFDHRDVSFVGRPFPLHEADEHLSRLRAWGFTFLRLLTTWEAVEHAGPGIYDEEYLDYIAGVAQAAGEHGIQLFVDPHQDVWSRMSGGDGAPGWTFEAVGMDVKRLSAAGAAIVHCVHGDPFPRMIWPTNYTKLAAATMFTLFFAGNDLAPRTTVDGEPVQEFLQRHYIAAVRQIASQLSGLPNVVGYGTLNEPSPGFVGWADLNRSGGLRLGDSPTPFQTMLLGSGTPQQVEVWGIGYTGNRRRGTRLVNSDGVSIWRDGYEPVWRQNGVWDLDSTGRPRLVRPDHFVYVRGHPVDFADDYLRPFIRRFAREIRSVDPDAIIFVEGPPGESPPHWGTEDPSGIVHAAHWYDGLTLVTKRYIPFLGADFHTRRLVLGHRRVQRSFARQLARIDAESAGRMGMVPTLIGEFGIPFDMHGRHAYRSGDFSHQARAMDDTFRALEANLLSGTLWNYTADNDNRWGDQWNDEDLSIFSRDQQANPADLNSGGRALEAVVRPYARATAGEPLRMSFDLQRRVFEFVFRHDPAVTAPTELFVPNLQYPHGYQVQVSDGQVQVDHTTQTVAYQHSTNRAKHTLRVF